MGRDKLVAIPILNEYDRIIGWAVNRVEDGDLVQIDEKNTIQEVRDRYPCAEVLL